MSTIVLRLDRQTREKLKELSEATGWRRADLVAEAVRRFVDLEYAALLEQQTREAAQRVEGESPAQVRMACKITV